MRVGEEISEPCFRDKFLRARALVGCGGTRQRRPRSARAVRALREPAPRGRSPEQALVFCPTQQQLQAHALVAPEQRQEPMCCRSTDDLDMAGFFECTK